MSCTSPVSKLRLALGLAFNFLSCVTLASADTVFPPASPPYSSSFVNPQPPNITTEFRAQWMQHKYDVNINTNIQSGYMYLSSTNSKIRLDGASDGVFQSSLFDFTNATTTGEVSNTILSYTDPSGSLLKQPNCSSIYVSPFILLVPPTILVTEGAVYAGIQHDDMYGPVSAWVFNYLNVVVTIFLDKSNTFVRYDFAAPGELRTFATTRFFDIVPGPIEKSVFETPCS